MNDHIDGDFQSHLDSIAKKRRIHELKERFDQNRKKEKATRINHVVCCLGLAETLLSECGGRLDVAITLLQGISAGSGLQYGENNE